MPDPLIKAGVEVRGLRELQLACKYAGKKANRDLRAELREVAEPIRSDAERLASSKIRRVGLKWSRMRVGVSGRLVYVAPRQRGVKTRGPDPRRRPAFGTLLAERAMQPAFEQNEDKINERVDDLFDRLANDWNRSGRKVVG